MEPQSEGALKAPAALLAKVMPTTLLVLDAAVDNVYHRLFGRSRDHKASLK
jgi:deoxyadenosine/deoxycytidine kinase